MTAQGLVSIVLGNPHYFCVKNLTDKLVALQKFVTVALSLNASTCILHIRNDKPTW